MGCCGSKPGYGNEVSYPPERKARNTKPVSHEEDVTRSLATFEADNGHSCNSSATVISCRSEVVGVCGKDITDKSADQGTKVENVEALSRASSIGGMTLHNDTISSYHFASMSCNGSMKDTYQRSKVAQKARDLLQQNWDTVLASHSAFRSAFNSWDPPTRRQVEHCWKTPTAASSVDQIKHLVEQGHFDATPQTGAAPLTRPRRPSGPPVYLQTGFLNAGSDSYANSPDRPSNCDENSCFNEHLKATNDDESPVNGGWESTSDDAASLAGKGQYASPGIRGQRTLSPCAYEPRFDHSNNGVGLHFNGPSDHK
ncbi:hypothetical protein DIPPA_57243 [Diplonema papillatum]|nr:hypothetical protein DIPPA_57243 [Diplonema papillatum]